jgi:hypothetical protein
VQVKARKVKRLFKIQKVVAHGVTFATPYCHQVVAYGVTLQRRTAIKHYSKLQNKKHNRNGDLTARNVRNLFISKGRHSLVLTLNLCPF